MSLSANAYSGMTHLQDPSEFADDGYGSLMGGGGAKKKKKPVLVLDADELEQAHQAIAMGGQTIMEAEDEPEAMERIRMPSSMLGLAPMGGDEEEDEADYGLSEEDTGSFADQEPGEYSEEGLSEEEEMEDDSSSIDFNLDHLLRPASREERDTDDEASIPSIEEQLKKMRALPIQSDEEPAEASFDPVPELDEPVAFEPQESEASYQEQEEEPVPFQPDEVEPPDAEPEQLVPQSFQPPDAEPEAEEQQFESEEQHETEEQYFTSDEAAPAEDAWAAEDVEQEFSASPISEPEAECEAEADAEPEIASEPVGNWSAPEEGLAPEAGIESAESWTETETESPLETASDAEPAWDESDQADLPEVEWAPESLEAPLDYAEDAVPSVEPIEEQEPAPVTCEESDLSHADAAPEADEDRWETPEADWSRTETASEDPIELAVPAVDENMEDEEAPLSFGSEEVEEVSEIEDIAAFVPEPEPAPAPEPELPPIPRNALRARVFQMEEERQARPASLIGRIWQRLFPR